MTPEATPPNGSLIERQAVEANEAKAAMKAFAEQRLAAMPGAKAPAKIEDTQGGEGAAGRTPDGRFAAKENATEAPAKPDKAKEAPAATATVDRSFLSEFDEKVRKSFESLPDEALSDLRKKLDARGLRQDDYTKKTMSVAEREKALKAEEETLRFGRAVIRDTEMLGAVKAIDDKRNGRAATAAKPTEPFDHITATPEQFAAHEAEVIQTAEERAFARLKADLDAKERAQSEKVAMAYAAKAAFVDTGDYEPETVNAVYDRIVALPGQVQITKDNVVEILRDFLPPPTAKVAAKPATDNLIPAASNPRQANGAASLARAGGVTPMVTTPAFIQQGKTPANVDERLQLAVYQVNARRAAAGKDLIGLGSR